MKYHTICFDCERLTDPDRMHDDYICIFCHEDADVVSIQKRFGLMDHPFVRYIPKSVRRKILRECGGLCQYCFGEEATQVDHIVPFSYIANHGPENLIGSCQTCNAMANDKMFPSLVEKRDWIQKRRLARARKTRMPIWVWSDLQKLSYNLRGGKKIIVQTEKEAQRVHTMLSDMGYNVVI